MRNRLLLFFLLLLTASPLPALAQHVTNYAPVDSLQVGDTFTYSLVLHRDRDYDSIIFPDSTDFGKDVEITHQKRYRVTNFTDSLAYRLQFFGTADSEIPKLPVRLVAGTDTTVLYTTPVPLYFKSLVKKPGEAFSPLKPIFDFAAAWWPYVLIVLGIAVAGWLSWRWYQRRRARPAEPAPRPEPEEPFVDPFDELATTLKLLEDSDLLQQKRDFKTFYIQLGDAVRQYFERIYDLPALESTTRELTHELHERAVDQELIRHTRTLLNEADMVKFAKFTPTLERARKALSEAGAFLARARTVDRQRVERLRKQHEGPEVRIPGENIEKMEAESV